MVSMSYKSYDRSSRSAVVLLLWAFIFWLPSSLVAQRQGDTQSQRNSRQGSELAEAGELKKQEAELRRALELSPNNPTHLANLGHILLDQGRPQEAKIHFEKALKLDPGNIRVRYRLAATQLQMD